MQQRTAAFERLFGVRGKIREICGKYGRRKFYCAGHSPSLFPSIADSSRNNLLSLSMRCRAARFTIPTQELFVSCCFPPQSQVRTSLAKLPPASLRASLFPAARRAHFHKTSGNLRAMSERASAWSEKRQTAPVFPTLLRQLASPRAAALPAARVPASRNFPSSPARDNAAAESAPSSSKKDTPAFHLHSKKSHQTHRHSEHRRVPREYPQAAFPAARKALAHGQSNAAQDRRKLPCPARASLSTNHGSQAGNDRTFLQTGLRVPVRRRRSFLRESKNRRPAAVPDKPSEISRSFARAPQARALPQRSSRTVCPQQRRGPLRGKP